MISERTRNALKAAKGRGVQLGNRSFGNANKQAAAARAETVRSLFVELDGLTTREIAEELTERTGEPWNRNARIAHTETFGIGLSRLETPSVPAVSIFLLMRPTPPAVLPQLG